MNGVRRAVIDIGTNSVKLLVGDISEAGVSPVCELSEQTRLGAGFFETQLLQPAAVKATGDCLKRFSTEARELGAEHLRVIATSAAREARNPEVLKEVVLSSTGLNLEIISGDQEALWAFQGVSSDGRFANAPLLLLDVGGGSTEFILGENGAILFKKSYPLGTVRLLEMLPHSDPPTPEELSKVRIFVEQFLKEQVLGDDPWKTWLQLFRMSPSDAKYKPPVLIGTGGTSTLLAKMRLKMAGYERDAIESVVIQRSDLMAQTSLLWSLPLEERKATPGLPSNRADVILIGTVIFETVMRILDFEELHISTKGLRYGALMAKD